MICRIDGPFSGCMSDDNIWDKSNAMIIMPTDEEVGIMADRIYYGPNRERYRRVYIAYRGRQLEPLQEEFNSAFSAERVLIENVLAKLRSYRECLTKVWRGSIPEHEMLLRTFAAITNIWIECDPLRTKTENRQTE